MGGTLDHASNSRRIEEKLLSFAIPGTVVGISYILAFNVPPFELTGTAARNKGLALFPRRIGGRYVAGRLRLAGYAGSIEAYIDGLNSRRGAVFSSNYEYPGRYTRWDTAIVRTEPSLQVI